MNPKYEEKRDEKTGDVFTRQIGSETWKKVPAPVFVGLTKTQIHYNWLNKTIENLNNEVNSYHTQLLECQNKYKNLRIENSELQNEIHKLQIEKSELQNEIHKLQIENSEYKTELYEILELFQVPPDQ